ncbi:MAG: amino acid permease [Candidatus Marinimicrobia bacterium]|nr:amino acid permease [FCB group bacterium]MBL7026178.1 amino acid permease [Candidatus Neomarinimicrobiota bacterium]
MLKNSKKSSSSETRKPKEKFGTFLGVYTPSVLTILGLIMYLRFGWVVGNLGLPLTLLVLLLSTAITFITGLSASAVATNMRVGVGGEYFIISRSLGLELGGAIGIPLFLCRTLSITFYSFGLAESIVAFWPASWGAVTPGLIQMIAAGIIVCITLVAGRSAGLALKLQIPIMLAVGLSILALAIGVLFGDIRTPELSATFRSAPEGFWYVFAVFFPAVTGFTAGIGMSGDLKDPQRSIPSGTILAIITGVIAYSFILVLLSITAQVSMAELSQPGIVWVHLAVLGAWLVLPGVWGAILSSAFGSVLSGPRVLQALATDGLAPKMFTRLSKTGQPTLATWVSGALALVAVLLGELNAVAQFVTILFLTLYVTINLSAALEMLAGDPSFRPRIRIPWYVSLLGSFGAMLVMFLINPLACIAAITLELMLYSFLRRQTLKKRWGDVRAGVWVALARFSLLKLRNHRSDPRNWRPHILLFVGDTSKRLGLVRLANWFNQNRGMVTACQLVVGTLDEKEIDPVILRQEMDQMLEVEGLVAFSEVDVVADYEQGVIDVVQANGMAGLQSNTVMFGWSNKPERLESMLRIMGLVARTGRSTIISRLNWAHEPGREMRIDIWWRGLQNNGDLMLLLAYLLSMNAQWRDAQITVRSIVENKKERTAMMNSLRKLVPASRIDAAMEVIIRPPDKSINDIMHENSGESDIVFLGIMPPKAGTEAEVAQKLDELASGFKTSIFVHNAGEFAGNLV